MDLASTTLDARIGPDRPFQHFAADSDGIAAPSAFRKANTVDLVVRPFDRLRKRVTGGSEKKPLSLP